MASIIVYKQESICNEGFCRSRTCIYKSIKTKNYMNKEIKLDGIYKKILEMRENQLLQIKSKKEKAIEKCMADYPEFVAEQVYERQHKTRQEIVWPIEETEQQCVQRWQNVSYEKKGLEKICLNYIQQKKSGYDQNQKLSLWIY